MRLVRWSMLVALVSCDGGVWGARSARNRPDSLPQLLGDAVPFRYPVGLYAQGVQGDVTLRLHVDSTGAVVAESLRVAESSGEPLLDAAALQGAPALRFRPALLGRRRVPQTVLFPVKFRVPPAVSTPPDTDGMLPGR